MLVRLGLLLLLSPLARAQGPPPNAQGAQPNLDTVTVEARRRKELEHEVDHYVDSLTGHPRGEALARWDEPICPLVAGLPRQEGEFVLARLSQIASKAGAPLAGEKCDANLFVVLSNEPEVLLRKWWARDRRLFATHNGVGAIRTFLDTPRPVRVWYNAGVLSAEGLPASSGVTLGGLVSPTLGTSNIPTTTVHSASRLRYGAVPGLSSVIVVVDTRRLEGLNFGQLADYVGLIGLAQVRLDADPGSAPTILRLFRAAADRPAALSPWDEAFLASLYRSEQGSVMQLSGMEHAMLDSIAR
ncbi:MAG: hypothetical protein JSR36_10805 [Proteobacteria bacterium]|nr:hypothetical protein [Pseudomonadota bacterium]